MSIDNVTDITPRRQYVAAVGQTVFAYPFPIFTNTDLVVDVNGTTKLLTTDYTVSGVGAATGGNATLLVACAGNEIVTVYRNLPVQRTTDFQANAPLSSATFNDELDKLVLMVQQVKESVNRALRIPITANVIDSDISLDPSTWSGKYLTFDSNGKPLPAVLSSTAVTQATIGALLYPRTQAEITASIIPTSTVYPAGNMLRYGADKTGVSDSTAAWNAALAQRVNGGEKIVFPPGVYKGNFIVTGQNIVIEMQEPFYEDVQTVGFIANNAANPVWSIGDGATLTTSIVFRGGLKLHGAATAQKGILFNGVQNCWIDGLIVRGFTTYGVSYTASTTRPTSYVYLNNYRIDSPLNAASAIGLLVTQPANYPTSYATALYLRGGALQANTGTLWAVQINANSTVYVSDSYWTMGNNVGINFSDAAGTGQIVCDNLMIDTLGTNNDVLVTCAANFPLANNLYGIYSINGKCSINGQVSAVALGGSGYLGNRTFCLYPSVVGSLDFQDSSANKADQQLYAQQLQTISRSGNNFFIKNGSGAILAQGTSLNLTNAAGSADAPLIFGITLIKALTGAGAPAVAAPVGSLYLRSDGGAATTLYVKESGTGTTGWVAK